MHARNHEYLHASRVTTPRVWTGLLLNEMYKVGSLIDQGATTELYDGVEVSTGEPVALKILLPQLADDAKTRTLFLDEARVLTRLSQPGLHRYRSCARDPQSELTYIVTDVVGARLSSRLGARKLSQQDIVDLTKRLALALGAAHRAGLVHRNLRPHAVALPEGRLSEAVVTDFNLIKAAHSGRNPAFDDAMLDHAFCAPEQLSKNREGAVVGPWTDIYSLALVVLAAMGAKSSDSDAAPDLSALPRKLRPVFERMLEPRPARRLQSMDDVARQLDLALGSDPLRSLLNRASSLSLPSFRRSEIDEPKAKAPPPAAAPKPLAPPTKPIAAATAKQLPQASAPARKPLPPLPESLLPAKKVPLGKFHEARASMGPGGIARRAAVALTALLLGASPWIIQTSLPRGPASATAVAPAPAPSPKAQAESRANLAARAVAALPKGQVYGSDNAYSRVTLRVHRPTRVIVHARGTRLLLNRMLQPGDSYRAPSLADLTLTTTDAGAIEVVYNGTPVGFVGRDGSPFEQLPLQRFASLAPPSPSDIANAAKVSPEPAIARTPAAPALTPEQAEAVARGLAAIEQEAQAGQASATEQVEAPSVAIDAETSPATIEQAIEEQSAQPPVALQEPPKPTVVLPEPPVPSTRPVAEVNNPATGALLKQVIVAPPPPVTEPEPEARRPLLQRLMPWRADRDTAPAPAPTVPNTAATALILAPSITKEAADREKAAVDLAKAARAAAQAKAVKENRSRDGAFFNSTLGINSRY